MRLTPVFCAAFGTAVGFYLLASLAPVMALVFLLVSIVALCFFRVLVSFCLKETVSDRYDVDLLFNGKLGEPRLLQLISVCIVAFTTGLVLGICAAGAGHRETKFAIAPDKIIAVEGTLLEDPRIISGGRAISVLSLQRCAGEGGIRASSSGEVTVFFPQESVERLKSFGRGAEVFSEGRLRLTETGWTFSASSMHIVKPAPAIERMRTGIRLNLIDRFEGKNPSGLSDGGGLALALLLGIRDNLDTNLAAMYRNAGSSYILALSGMHLAVLAALLAFLLKKPLGLKASSVVGAVIICLYCFIVGPMPSLNRAALMYLLGVIAILGALPKEPVSILSLSFLIQIVISPAAGYSISFILSYLALAGILIIGWPLYSLFAGKVPDFLLQPLSASCGAFLATAGVTCFSFGVIVPMGIITGLVLVPLTTVFMTVSLLWLVLDFLSLSGFLSFPLSLLYMLMEGIVFMAGRLGGISAARPSVILALSIAVSLLVVALEYKLRQARLKLRPFP
jgi:competence protein ComEC